ncbi:MAG: prephenate dehydratase [Pirellulaceae bacterium]|nr:prephenate dehydratase [Planctomycetales bacterium]
MASRVPASRAKSKPADLRKKLDQLDKEIVKLANERAKVYERMVRGSDEAEEVMLSPHDFAGLLAANKGPLCEATLKSLLFAIDSGSRALASRTRVAYLGPAYSYSHLAATHAFGEAHELVPVATIAAVFEEVNRRQVTFGVVPLENSTDGRVADTLDMFVRSPVKICGEVQLKIHHYLLSRSERSEIVEIYSKPQALSQCRAWLARHMPGAKLVEMTSTAAAAQLAAERPGAAAIASRQAAAQYGLNIVESDIEDNRFNMTRFAVIGQSVPKRSGHDKTALMFELPHQPGALADAMAVFRNNQLNLTWIESFPMPGTKNEYLFFVEVQGHETNPKIQKTLASLQRKTVRTVVLGSYPQGTPVE